MSMTAPARAQCLREIDDLFLRNPDVRAAMLALRDGRPYAEKSRAKIDAGRFAAMASSLVALGASVLRELGSGVLDHVVVEGAEGRLVVCSVPESRNTLILAVLASEQARLGLVLGHARATAASIGRQITHS